MRVITTSEALEIVLGTAVVNAWLDYKEAIGANDEEGNTYIP